jgi:hypothetical protein
MAFVSPGKARAASKQKGNSAWSHKSGNVSHV